MASKKKKKKTAPPTHVTPVKKHLKYSWVIILSLVMIGLFLTRERVVTKDVTWTCGRTGCEVRFTIENKTRKMINHRYVIRAFRNRSVDHRAIVSDVVGEKEVDFTLYNNESKAFTDTLVLTYPGCVDLISVNSYESNQTRIKDP